MKSIRYLQIAVLICATVMSALAQNHERHTLIVTASNAVSNDLLVYNTAGQIQQTVSTGGNGGVSGNAGGIASSNGRLAVVNFGSQNVSIFVRSDSGFRLEQLIPAASSPVSVAFGHGHLYVLGTTTVESHPVSDFGVSANADGTKTLLKADGSAAQVGVLEDQLIVTEKSNGIETLLLSADGAITGNPNPVRNIPSNVDVPLGLATRDNEAYVTIAHANEISLVRDDAVITTTASGTQMAPCWLALDGPWLYSANTPSQSVSRYLVYNNVIIQKQAVAAAFNGGPTDISYDSGWLAVIDEAGSVSHLSVFRVAGDGALMLQNVSTIDASANGVAVIGDDK